MAFPSLHHFDLALTEPGAGSVPLMDGAVLPEGPCIAEAGDIRRHKVHGDMLHQRRHPPGLSLRRAEHHRILREQFRLPIGDDRYVLAKLAGHPDAVLQPVKGRGTGVGYEEGADVVCILQEIR